MTDHEKAVGFLSTVYMVIANMIVNGGFPDGVSCGGAIEPRGHDHTLHITVFLTTTRVYEASYRLDTLEIVKFADANFEGSAKQIGERCMETMVENYKFRKPWDPKLDWPFPGYAETLANHKAGKRVVYDRTDLHARPL